MAIALGLRRNSPRALESLNKDTSKRESPDSYNPYLAARREWDERYGDQIVRARNWRTMAALCAAIALLETVGLLWMSSHSRVFPFVVLIDNIGRPVASGFAEQDDGQRRSGETIDHFQLG